MLDQFQKDEEYLSMVRMNNQSAINKAQNLNFRNRNKSNNYKKYKYRKLAQEALLIKEEEEQENTQNDKIIEDETFDPL